MKNLQEKFQKCLIKDRRKKKAQDSSLLRNHISQVSLNMDENDEPRDLVIDENLEKDEEELQLPTSLFDFEDDSGALIEEHGFFQVELEPEAGTSCESPKQRSHPEQRRKKTRIKIISKLKKFSDTRFCQSVRIRKMMRRKLSR